jgi:outer membrane protein assembly factor BamB
MSSPTEPAAASGIAPGIDRLIFVGFNSRVVALDRDNGAVVWKWKSPSGMGIPAVLLDGDRLIVSVQGYTHCLDPASGEELWNNPLKGMGVGTPCLASARGNTTPQLYAVLAEFERQRSDSADVG